LLIEARGTASAADAADLVAALSTHRPLFRGRPEDPDADLREPGCDAVALIRAVREGEPDRHLLDRLGLRDARQASRRLRALLDAEAPPRAIDRRALAETILRAWPDAAHVARRHGKRIGWSNGGTELELGRDVALQPHQVDDHPFALVLDTRAVGRSRLDQRILATALMPVPKAWLVGADLGRMQLRRPVLSGGAAMAVVERVYAGRVLERTETVPTGELARQAVARLFLDGRIFDVDAAEDRLAARALWARLNDEPDPPDLEDWVAQRLETLGLERGDELALLSAEDLLPEDLDPWNREKLDRTYPRTLDLPDATYALSYHPRRRLLELVKTAGPRKDLPPLRFVPRLPGWRIEVVHKNVRRTLRR